MNQVNKLVVPISIIIAGGLIAFAIFFTSSKTPTAKQNLGSLASATGDTTPVIAPVTSADHIRGNKDAKVVIIDYSDLECPFCKGFHASIKNIFAKYGADNKVAWVYRHFPLDIHPKARKEAEGAECANELGGDDSFWNFIDKIYQVTPSNNNLDEKELGNSAAAIGLDRVAFQTCLDSGKYTAKIEEQYQAALKAGARGTPYTVIVAKGQTIPLVDEKGQGMGALPEAALKSIVEQFTK